jgi:hypothetical protein
MLSLTVNRANVKAHSILYHNTIRYGTVVVINYLAVWAWREVTRYWDGMEENGNGAE